MTTYKEIVGGIANSATTIVRDNSDGTTTSFQADHANTDYQAYLKWLEEGNTPEAADEVVNG